MTRTAAADDGKGAGNELHGVSIDKLIFDDVRPRGRFRNGYRSYPLFGQNSVSDLLVRCRQHFDLHCLESQHLSVCFIY